MFIVDLPLSKLAILLQLLLLDVALFRQTFDSLFNGLELAWRLLVCWSCPVYEFEVVPNDVHSVPDLVRQVLFCVFFRHQELVVGVPFVQVLALLQHRTLLAPHEGWAIFTRPEGGFQTLICHAVLVQGLP